MPIILSGVAQDSLPLVPLVIALVWTLRYQRVADFSLAGSFSLAAAITAVSIDSGATLFIAVLLGLGAGLCVGGLTGIIFNYLRIESLLAGVLMLFMSYSCSLGITQGTIRIPARLNPLDFFQRKAYLAGELLVYSGLAALVLALSWWTLNSEWGCAFRALEAGSSGRTFLRSLGISPLRLSLMGYAVAGGLSATSGILVAMRDGQATSSLGTDTLIDVIPAYLLGLSLFENRPSFKIARNDQKPLSYFRYLHFASPVIAAPLGVLLFFALVNLSLQWVRVGWLPRLVLGIAVVLLLGVPDYVATYKKQRKQVHQTQTTRVSSALEVNDLSVTYPTLNGPQSVIREGNIVLETGALVQLAGPNGSGKSSFLKALSGRLECDGKFIIPTVSSHRKYRFRDRLVAYVPQDPSDDLVDSLTLAEHVILCRTGTKASVFRRWRRVLEHDLNKLPLRDPLAFAASFPQWLSGGERRRALLGLLLLRGEDLPRVICLDEPFAYLDESGMAYCSDFIRKLTEKGHIVIVTSHGETMTPSPQIISTWGSIRLTAQGAGK